MALLDHYNDKDHHFYRFAKLLCEQVRYPGSPPLMSAHSTEYYYAQPITNIISVPLFEDQFLLGLPDLLHELGHLFFSRNREAILGPFAVILRGYVQEEKKRAADEASSDAYQDYFDLLEQVWLQRYVVEFSCDMFASYLVGPAYGWSHLRLVLASKIELYRPSFGEEGTHPADEARMRGIIETLEQLESSASGNIADKWEQFKAIVGDTPEEEYWYCYPDRLLQQLAQRVITVCEDHNLKSYYNQSKDDSNLPSLMQRAWENFHKDSEKYADWEAAKVEELRSLLS